MRVTRKIGEMLDALAELLIIKPPLVPIPIRKHPRRRRAAGKRSE